MAKDINKNPYSKETLLKLAIFEKYLEAWLPVFIFHQYRNNVMICDFFAGSGEDINGISGSPLRIVQTIGKYRDQILKKKFNIEVILNDNTKCKTDILKIKVNECIDKYILKNNVTVSYHTDKFQNLFNQIDHQLCKQPNLIFIDQNGIKEVSDRIFQRLISFDNTDFLFFISSSYMRRFISTPEFISCFPGIDPEEISQVKYEDIHRYMLEYYKDKIPKGNNTKLYPFTFKKGANIYGLIFGSKHPLGVEKFLDIVWGKNKINGEANFDIDNDIEKNMSLFPQERKMTKQKVFKDKLEKYIIKRGKVNNQDVYNFTLENGHPKLHAREYTKQLKDEGKIHYKGNIGFSYKSCIKGNPKLIDIKAINNG